MKPRQFSQFLLGLSLIATLLIVSANASPRDKKPKDEKRAVPPCEVALVRIEALNLPALRRAVTDLSETYPKEYPGAQYLARLASIEKELPGVLERLQADDESALPEVESMLAFKREALLGNPLLNFERLLLVKRGAKSPKLGLPQNWQGNCALPRSGFDDEIAILSMSDPQGPLETFYKPGDRFVGDVDLHFDADKMLFSSLDDDELWQIYEINADGSGLRQVSPDGHCDVDNYDACYLPDGRILFDSTAPMIGVPCVGGKTAVANLYLTDGKGGPMRQLCFEQDHDWCPTILNNGRVLYTRWEYTDNSHYFSRILMHMNPDGTAQTAYYGSNSYWPNSMFYARPIPDHPTKVVAVISGHHGDARMGQLALFDPAIGRTEADGAVQLIPGYGKKVEPVILDRLVAGIWPKFLHPYPLDENYFLVACQPTDKALWGLYLVDTFDNMQLLKEMDEYALLEPVPFRKTKKPPVIPDRIDLDRKDALIHMADIYVGPGLKDVPRGTIKKMRVLEWDYAYQKIGGHRAVTVEGGWEPKRILGTVPVHEDGSVLFRAPANTPISVQPLDAEGKAVQLMRSWMTAMPGETLSCVGCHEQQNTSPPSLRTLAATRTPSEIEPWYGEPRGFGFIREVQPVLNEYCVGCHNGEPHESGHELPNFADTTPGEGGFTSSYLALHPYVRRPGPEGDFHMLRPMEFHADTSELVQMLQKGHQGVQLDHEAWDRIVTWIDFNVPDFGTWAEKYDEEQIGVTQERRSELRALYAHIDRDAEIPSQTTLEPVEPIIPTPKPRLVVQQVSCPNWPLGANAAQALQNAAADVTRRSVDLGDGVTMDFVLVPAGDFVMGDPEGELDEQPLSRVRIAKPFWISVTEVTNQQYNRFDATHDSRYADQQWKDHTTPGYPLNLPQQPVVRVSWNEAMAFTRWLSNSENKPYTLPDEAQWEYACRAGTDTAFHFGGLDDDFSVYANLADASIKLLAVKGVNPKPIAKPTILEDFVPRDDRFDDRAMITTDVGSYQPNPWGICDMQGNAAEWTRSTYAAYPFEAGSDASEGQKSVRGGSWRDRPHRARAGFRSSYASWQKVYNVGFRVICEEQALSLASTE